MALSQVHDFAREQLKVAANRQKAQYDKTSKTVKFHEGQFVWRYYPPTAKQKLGKGWVGPYKVISCPTAIHCDIARAPGSSPVRIHIDQLKPHHGKVPHVWESSDDSDSDSHDSVVADNSVPVPHNSSNHSESELPASSAESDIDAHPANVRRSRRTIRQPRRLDL